MTLPPALAACAAIVEKGDPDRFAATMAAPPDLRLILWPLYAFNLEVARAPYASTEPMVAEMRLQWWIDQLEALAVGKRPEGSVAEALQPLVFARPEVAPLLAAIAAARRIECWPEPFENSDALRAYLDQTAGNLTWAATLLLGASSGDEKAIRQFGFALGLANWFHARPDLIRHNRLSLNDANDAAIISLAKEGLTSYRRAAGLLKTVPASVVPALWTGWAAVTRLKAAAADPRRIEEGRLGPSELLRPLALMWRVLTNRI